MQLSWLIVVIGHIWPAAYGRCSWSIAHHRSKCDSENRQRGLGDTTAIKTRDENDKKLRATKARIPPLKAAESASEIVKRSEKAKSSTVGSTPRSSSSPFRSKGSSTACPGPSDGSSTVPPPLLASDKTGNVSNAEAAATWWRCVVPGAAAASPPSVGKATLFFVHVPKVGGTSLEQVFNGLTESRPPLCARRFMDSLEGCPAAKRDKGIGCAAARKVSTRGKYRNQHCLRNSSNLLWGHLSLDIEGAKHVNLPAASHMSTLSRRSLRLSRESKSSSIGRSRSWNDHSTRQLKTAVPSAPFVPPVYTMVILREPVARLVSLANYLGVSLSAFESNWAMKNAVNTQTAMVNGVPNIGPLNVNGHSHDRGSCVHSASEAITESRRRLLTTYTVAGTTETYVRTVWLTQRAFGWGEAAIFSALAHPRKGFRTPGARAKGVEVFSMSSVSPELLAKLQRREQCDTATHSFAGTVVASRLKAMPTTDRSALEAFERRLAMETKATGSKRPV